MGRRFQYARRCTALATSVCVLLTCASSGCNYDVLHLVQDISAKPIYQIVTDRYFAGDYPGTINNTLDDDHVIYHFTYVNGVTLWALLMLHEETANSEYLEAVRVAVAKYDRDGLYRPNGGDEPIDYLGSMAHATLVFGETHTDDTAREHGLNAAAYFLSDCARTPEDLIAYHSNPSRGRIWADALFMVMPLMAKAGRIQDDTRYFDDVLRQFAGFTAKLRDPTVGLYHQGWNWHGEGASPGYWGRANGWVLVAMTETLGAIPDDYEGRDELLALYQDFAAAVVHNQASDGMWHQLLNRPDSYKETSCTGMFVYALARGVEREWLPRAYADNARQGFAALSRYVSWDGDIRNICPGTPTQASEKDYLNRGPRTNDSHGIGPVLLGTVGGLILDRLPSID